MSSKLRAGIRLTAMVVGVAVALVGSSQVSEAQRRGGGGVREGGGGRSSMGGARTSSGGGNRSLNGSGGATRTSVNRDFSPSTIGGNTNISGNRNISANQNINVNHNYDLDYDVDNAWHPVARGAAFAAGAAVTTSAIGSIAYSLPASCTATVVGGMTYQHCGSAWYQPRYVGTSVQYVVVASPQ